MGNTVGSCGFQHLRMWERIWGFEICFQFIHRVSKATFKWNYMCNLISLPQAYISFIISHREIFFALGNGNDTFTPSTSPTQKSKGESTSKGSLPFNKPSLTILQQSSIVTAVISQDPAILTTRNGHLSYVYLTGLDWKCYFANLVSYLKTFSDQKDPLETQVPQLFNSQTSKPGEKTAARKFFLFSLNLKQGFCSKTIQISSMESQGNYKTYSQVLWSEYFQCWSHHSNKGWASFPLPVDWTWTQQFFLDHFTG